MFTDCEVCFRSRLQLLDPLASSEAHPVFITLSRIQWKLMSGRTDQCLSHSLKCITEPKKLKTIFYDWAAAKKPISRRQPITNNRQLIAMTWFFGETAPGRRKLGRSWCAFGKREVLSEINEKCVSAFREWNSPALTFDFILSESLHRNPFTLKSSALHFRETNLHARI